MGMPVDLVLVRHGESEGNVAVHSSKRGDDRHVENPEFRGRHSSWWRLTPKGVQQAEQAGAWIREHIGSSFDRYYTSAYTRAMETAGHLSLPNASWYIEPKLRERERGKEDLVSSRERELLVDSARERKNAPLYWRPLNGESIADTCERIRVMHETLHREADGGRVIIVCHGEVMEAFRVTLERMTHHDYIDWTSSDDPADRINNGQVFHYTRRDPDTGEIGPYLDWRRSVCTSDLTLCDPTWKQVSRPVFDNAALIEMAQRTQRLIEG